MNKRSKSQISLKLQHTEQHLQSLQHKIQQSKPILNSIYSKVKHKQAYLTNQLQKHKQRLLNTHQIAQQYMQLYEEGLDIMQRNHLYDSYTHNNYLPINQHQQPSPIHQPKSLYQQFKSKLNNRKQINPQTKLISQKAKQISQEIQQGIMQLRIARQKSQSTLNKYKPFDQMREVQSRESVEKFIQLQKKKLQTLK